MLSFQAFQKWWNQKWWRSFSFSSEKSHKKLRSQASWSLRNRGHTIFCLYISDFQRYEKNRLSFCDVLFLAILFFVLRTIYRTRWLFLGQISTWAPNKSQYMQNWKESLQKKCFPRKCTISEYAKFSHVLFRN